MWATINLNQTHSHPIPWRSINLECLEDVATNIWLVNSQDTAIPFTRTHNQSMSKPCGVDKYPAIENPQQLRIHLNWNYRFLDNITTPYPLYHRESEELFASIPKSFSMLRTRSSNEMHHKNDVRSSALCQVHQSSYSTEV